MASTESEGENSDSEGGLGWAPAGCGGDAEPGPAWPTARLMSESPMTWRLPGHPWTIVTGWQGQVEGMDPENLSLPEAALVPKFATLFLWMQDIWGKF